MIENEDISVLTALDALLQEGSVTGAARRMGLSTPAMSHALARIRERLKDPILVRSGRSMVLTPRAQALKPKVHSVVTEARHVLEPERPFVSVELERTFVVHVSDYVLTVLGLAVDRLLREEAPRASLRFVVDTADDAAQLRDGGSDLAVGIYGDLPAEMRSRLLLTDRFVCVARAKNPIAARRMTLEQFVAVPHIQVAPRGQPGGYIDDALRERGYARAVARAVPYFTTALQMVSRTDYLLTISERIARQFADDLALAVFEVPLELRPYALSLVWHPRFDADPAHRFLREAFVRAAKESAADRHESPRLRLDAGDPTTGERRKRRRKKR